MTAPNDPQERASSDDGSGDAGVLHAHIRPLGRTFPIRPAETVLQAALRAGVRLPSSCRNGTCRTCLSLLSSGSVRYQVEWPGLSADEKAEGYFLPCVACAETDLVVEVVGMG